MGNNHLTSDEFQVFVIAFMFTFWQPGIVYAQQIWQSKWYQQIYDNTELLQDLTSKFFAIMWALMFTCMATSWFLFWKSHTGASTMHDAIHALIITTIVATKLWTVLVASISSVWIFLFASLLTWIPGAAAWVLMLIHLGSGPADIIIYILWGLFVLYTTFATFFISGTIIYYNKDKDFSGMDWNISSGYPQKNKK